MVDKLVLEPLMGSMAGVLGERMNEDLRGIYRVAFSFILSEMCSLFKAVVPKRADSAKTLRARSRSIGHGDYAKRSKSVEVIRNMCVQHATNTK